MTDPYSVEAELVQLAGILEDLEAEAPARDTGDWFTLQSFRHRQVVLLQEQATQGAPLLELTLSGGPVVGHTVNASFAGQLLDQLQRLVTSVGQALDGEVTLRAPVPRATADRVALRVVATAPGSFRLLLDGPAQPAAIQDALPGLEADPLLEASLSSIMDVLEASADVEDYQRSVLKRAQPLGGRARGHLRGLAALLVAADASLTVQLVRGGDAETGRRAHVDPERARRVQAVLSGAHEYEETVRRRGRLVGTSWPAETFDLESTLEGGHLHVIHGQIEPQLRDVVSRVFDRDVTAILLRRVLASDTGEEATSYRLIGLAE